DVISTENGDDTVFLSLLDSNLNNRVDGGLGTDTLMIQGNSSRLVVDMNNVTNEVSGITGTTIANFEQFDLSDFSGHLNFTGTAGNDLIKLDSSSLSQQSDAVLAGNGDDTIDTNLSYLYTIRAPLGSNPIYEVDFNAIGRIDGGSGMDTLIINGVNSSLASTSIINVSSNG
ncbi:MAG: hypothetical protein ACKO5Q_23610, partial [Microcystaceae cyanobacterium]